MRNASVTGSGAAWRHAGRRSAAVFCLLAAQACLVDLGDERVLANVDPGANGGGGGDGGTATAWTSSTSVASSTTATSTTTAGLDVVSSSSTGGEPLPGDCDGTQVRWALQLGGLGRDLARAVAPDGQGGVFITGGFSSKVDLGGAELQGEGFNDNFVARFDGDGKHIWSKPFGDSANQDTWSVEAAANGDLLLFGSFNGTIDFGGGDEHGDVADAFIVRYDPLGNFIWQKVFPGAAHQVIKDLIVEPVSGDLLIGGLFHNTIDIGGGTWTSAGDADAFIARLDASGGYIWGRPMVGSAADYTFGIANDGQGRLLAAGSADGDIDLGEGVWTAFGDGASDAWVGLYDADTGVPEWTRLFAAEKYQVARKVTFEASGTPVVSGTFHDNLVFDSTLSSHASGIYVARLDGLGMSNDVVVIANALDVTSLAPRYSSDLLLTGFWGNSLGTGSVPVATQGKSDGMLVALDGALFPTSTLIIGSPQSDDLSEVATGKGGEAFAFGTFRETVSVAGCDDLTSAGDADMVLLKLAP